MSYQRVVEASHPVVLHGFMLAGVRLRNSPILIIGKPFFPSYLSLKSHGFFVDKAASQLDALTRALILRRWHASKMAVVISACRICSQGRQGHRTGFRGGLEVVMNCDVRRGRMIASQGQPVKGVPFVEPEELKQEVKEEEKYPLRLSRLR